LALGRLNLRLDSRLAKVAALANLRQSAPAQITLPATDPLASLRSDPTLPMRAMGMQPDPWQVDLITCPARQIAALCTRRSGKTASTASRVTVRCLTQRTRALIFAPTEDQSKELLWFVREMNAALGFPVPLIRESQTELAWANGSTLKAKTDRPKSSRGPTPNLMVIDEAAQVSDELHLSILPMMVLGQCELLALTTPFGKLGWFFEMWTNQVKRAAWQTFTITAEQCPRIDRYILEEHRATMPPRWFDQEYMCVFNDAVDSVFGKSVIESACKVDDAFLPLAL